MALTSIRHVPLVLSSLIAGKTWEALGNSKEEEQIVSLNTYVKKRE